MNFFLNQFAALKREREREREREKGVKWEKETDLQLEKKITYPVRQLHHEDRLPNHQVYLPWEVWQSLMLSC